MAGEAPGGELVGGGGRERRLSTGGGRERIRLLLCNLVKNFDGERRECGSAATAEEEVPGGAATRLFFGDRRVGRPATQRFTTLVVSFSPCALRFAAASTVPILRHQSPIHHDTTTTEFPIPVRLHSTQSKVLRWSGDGLPCCGQVAAHLGSLQPSLLLQELRECQHLDSTTVAASASATGSGSPDIEGMAQADFFFGPELDDLMQQLGDGDTGEGMLAAFVVPSASAQSGERASGWRLEERDGVGHRRAESQRGETGRKKRWR